MIACVFAANQISKKLQLGFAGNLYVEPLTEAMRERLGGDLDTVINQLGNIKPFVDEARLFTRLET
jgi:hypothetical protein